jgi:translation initiation factor 2 subunit 1
MNLKKQPEEEELVLCTVTAINPHSVFVTLDEYNDKTALIHISEVSPGRIRNIRDYVKEGKKIVCKILRINPEKGHIDLSLRRVNESQRRTKLDEIKKEQLSEKIIEQTAKKHKQDFKKLLSEISEKLLKKHDSLFEAFELVSEDKIDLKKIIEKKIAEDITEIIKQRIKPPEIKISGTLKLSTYDPEGIEKIKKNLDIFEKAGIKVKYAGKGMYNISLISDDYKKAEKILGKALKESEEHAQKNTIKMLFERKDE